MARPISSRYVQTIQPPEQGDLIAAPQREMWWTPCKGMNTTLPAQVLNRQQLAWAENVGINYGIIRTRPGVRNVGAATTGLTPDTNITTVTEFTTSSGISYLLRMGLFGIQYFDGTVWNTIPGYTAPATMTVYDKFACTAFGDVLVFSDGISGMYKYDPVGGVASLISGAPSAKHLTTFNSRIVASYVTDTSGLPHPTRIQWSVKNNSLDWTGIGSGSEDLLSTPGGFIDEQTGVYPVNDYAAMVVRTNSVWQMTSTGNVDAPFNFERRYAGLGSKQRHSIASIPGGICGMFNDLSIYIITESSIESIGDDIRDPRWTRTGLRVSRDGTNFPNLLAVGAYSQRQRKYTIALSSRSASVGVTGGFTAAMYQYDIDSKTWSNLTWPDTSIHWVTYSTGTLIGLTIDSSTGTIDAAGTASIDSEVGNVPYGEQDSLIAASGGYVYREDRNLYQDITTAFGTVNISQSLVSAQLVASSPLDAIEMVGLRLLYQSSVAGNLTLRMHTWVGGSESTVNYILPLIATMDATDNIVQGTRVAYVPFRSTGYDTFFEIINALNGRVEIIGVIPEIMGKTDVNAGYSLV